MAGATVKLTTGLTGLAVNNAPHHTLGILYGKLLRTLQKMPESAGYRKNTEQIIKQRAEVLKNTQDAAKIEKLVGCGQVEELIVQAENELILARKILNWKPWEPLIEQSPPNQWVWPPV